MRVSHGLAKNLCLDEKPATDSPVGSKLVATFTQNGVEHELTLKGDFWGGSANITMKDGPAIAHISRKLATVGEFFGDKQTVSVLKGKLTAVLRISCSRCRCRTHRYRVYLL